MLGPPDAIVLLEGVGPPPLGGTIVNDSALLDEQARVESGADSALKCSIVTAPGRFGTIQSSPRWQLAQSLANGVLAALNGGDLTGARAAAAALLEFIERLDGKDFPGSLDRAETKARGG